MFTQPHLNMGGGGGGFERESYANPRHSGMFA